MAENTENKSENTENTENKAESKPEAKKSTRRGKITVRGRVATTALEEGREVEVERTEAIDRLLAQGYVEEV